MKITLTRDELIYAAKGGVERRVDGYLKGRRDRFQQPDPFHRDILGAMAELAVAKARNRYWFPVYDDPRGVVDIGERGQVRSSENPNARLVVRDSDADDHAFCLVITDPPEFDLVGWLWGHEAKQDRWHVEGDGNKPPAWLVPQAELKRFEKPDLKVVA